MKLTAKDIIELLKVKHHADIFVSECKTGSTWFNKNLLKLDAWVMNRSWVNNNIIGYEIKVSRQDFLNDKKYLGYLKYCNEFYFVCPYNIVLPSELEDNIGLYYITKTGNRLIKKKKAVRNDIKAENLIDIMMYILMSRSKIVKSGYYDELSAKEYWSKWLVDKQLNYKFGRQVAKNIRQRVDKEINEVKLENDRLKSKIQVYEEIEKFLNKIDFKVCNFSYFNGKEKLKQKIKQIETGLSQDLNIYFDELIKNINMIKDELNKDN